jgi:hypothetical protein
MPGRGGLPGPRVDQRRRPAGSAMSPGSASVIRARLIIVSGDGDGLFVYDGPPGIGNSPIFWASPGLVDPFGNVLPATAGIASTGTFQAGNTVITPAGIFFYSPSPGPGNLILSFAAAPGNDEFGNPYPRGTGLWQASLTTGNEANYLTGAASESVPAQIYTFVDNQGGASEQMQLNAQSAQSTAIQDRAVMALLSAAADLSQPNAIGELGYIKAGATSISPMLSWGPGGIFAIGTTVAAAPGASPSSPAVAETWRTMILQNGWTAVGRAEYQMGPDKRVYLQMTNVTVGTFADNTVVWNIPAAYIPSNSSNCNMAMSVNYSTAPAFGSTPILAARNSGILVVQNLRGTPSNISLTASYPLN